MSNNSTEFPNVFDFSDSEGYKKYLCAWIAVHPASGHGMKSKIAEALRCHVAYISQVLNANAQLSLEQAHDFSAFAEHSEEETEYFELLVLLGRAGSASLRDQYSRRIQKIHAARSVIQNRIKHKRSLNALAQLTYYSSWHYAAIHMALYMDELQTAAAIAKRFALPLRKTAEILDFLTEHGLANNSNGRYTSGNTNLHLGQDSPMLARHHGNWRLRALHSLDAASPQDLHYSSVACFAEKDVSVLREALVRTIESVRGTIDETPAAEKLYCINFDLFSL